MSELSVERQSAQEFRLTVTDQDGSETTHTVTVEPEYRDYLGWKENETEELLRQSFGFLLEREPKESILSEFKLQVIKKYFPEYESFIRP